MELHPILESRVAPNRGLWYVLGAFGDSPSMRVGHTATFMASHDGEPDQIVVVGGANPDGPFADTYVLDLQTLSWDRWDCPSMKARYEHSVFTVPDQPGRLFVFGGADQSGNHNDIQALSLSEKSWSTVETQGTAPSPRTLHMSCCLHGKFYVYSGGHMASDPVGDRQVYEYDVASSTWCALRMKGDAPKPRLGHVMVAMENKNKILLHGGMSGTTFYDDLFILDPTAGIWSSIKQKKSRPSARAAHAAVTRGDSVYIFGGMNKEGALNDFHQLDTTNMQWSRICLGGPPPAPRLDYAMCVAKLRVDVAASEASGEAGDVNACREQAQEVLETQLRLGSAGSGASVAGSITSTDSGSEAAGLAPIVTRLRETNPSDGGAEGEAAEKVAAETEGAPATETEGATAVEENVVDVCVVIGGMDTEGEIFDDVLTFLLH